jgi:hypothetical protein
MEEKDNRAIETAISGTNAPLSTGLLTGYYAIITDLLSDFVDKRSYLGVYSTAFDLFAAKYPRIFVLLKHRNAIFSGSESGRAQNTGDVT